MEHRHRSTAKTIKKIKQICHGNDSRNDEEEAADANEHHFSSMGAAREKLAALFLPEESLVAHHVCLRAPPSMHTETLTRVLNVSRVL